LLEADKFSELNERMSAVQSDYRQGRIDDDQLATAFRVFYDPDPKLLAKYDGWVAAFPRSYVALLARGIYHRKVGQARRGGDVISNTSASQLQGMDYEYDLAMRDLQTSLPLEKKPLLTLSNELDIAAYQGNDNAERSILDLSVQIDPQNIAVRRPYLIYLAPRWGGSMEQMQAFLDESQKAGLAEKKVRLLEGVIAAERGAIARDERDYPAAELYYRQAMEYGAEECTNCLSYVLMQQRKYDQAIVVLTKAITDDPSNVALHRERARAYLAAGNIRDALPDFMSAAQQGDAYSQSQVGVWYMTGIDGILVPDSERGLEWFHKCALQGDPTCVEDESRALHMLKAVSESH